MRAVFDFLLSPEFRGAILLLGCAASLTSAALTWYAWVLRRSRPVLAVAIVFSGWSISTLFFATRYLSGSTDFSSGWFILPNLASLVMIFGAFYFDYTLLVAGKPRVETPDD